MTTDTTTEDENSLPECARMLCEARRKHGLKVVDIATRLEPQPNTNTVYRWMRGERSPLFDCWKAQLEEIFGIPRNLWRTKGEATNRAEWLEQHPEGARRFKQLELPGTEAPL